MIFSKITNKRKIILVKSPSNARDLKYSLWDGTKYIFFHIAIPALVGIFTALYIINPWSAEKQFKANSLAVNAEIQENQQIISSDLKQDEKIICPAIGPDKKNTNLETVSAMSQFSFKNYNQLEISYQQLSSTSQATKSKTNEKIKNLYKQYDELNQKINNMNSIIVSALGFTGDIFWPYVRTFRTEIGNSAYCLSRIKFKDTDNLPDEITCGTSSPPFIQDIKLEKSGPCPN